jgi:hypothetical protein
MVLTKFVTTGNVVLLQLKLSPKSAMDLMTTATVPSTTVRQLEKIRAVLPADPADSTW